MTERVAVQLPTPQGWHEEFVAGGQIYQVDVQATGDERLTVAFTGCDRDGQIITSLTGVLPAEGVSSFRQAMGALLARIERRVKAPLDRAYTVPQVRTRHPKAYERWTPEEEQLLLDRWGAQVSVDEIAGEFGRNTGAIVARLQKLGALPADQPAPLGNSIYEEFGRPVPAALPAPWIPAPSTSTPQLPAGAPFAVITIVVGGLEAFDSAVELLMRAGAIGLGQRRFAVNPPLSAGQVEALRNLHGYEGSVTVSPPPSEGGIWQPDPVAPEPSADFREESWWAWQNNHLGDPARKPGEHRRWYSDWE
ncbi:hypothetical protein O7606_12620 [Micromonospora sp. WMMD882]|uniref:hypothetical protein n=1 Tax=Micromonospora sp. WMMD882 TaxID=3015151 RepID=UPI00248ADF9E|nr:hypothetical protein [Micromonospora sp. WMMD882]WBB82130.1 hypothetical protein O7606_12620 [Micromonospora sp. WMMD882]